MSGRSVQPCPNPRRQLIVTNVEQPAIRLDPRRRAPEGDERARQRRVADIDRNGIVQHARMPDGVIAQPSAPQFPSSHSVISV